MTWVLAIQNKKVYFIRILLLYTNIGTVTKPATIQETLIQKAGKELN